MPKFDNLREINRNADGNYYFIYSVPQVRNFINTKAKPRDEVIIVGVNQKYLVQYLNPSDSWHKEYEQLITMINQMSYDPNFRELMIKTLDEMVSTLLGDYHETNK